MDEWTEARIRLRNERKKIIREMMKVGATKEQMAEVTGYAVGTVEGIIAEIKWDYRFEGEDESNLVRVKHEMPNLPKVEYEGKTYLDVTELFMPSEWMAEEER